MSSSFFARGLKAAPILFAVSCVLVAAAAVRPDAAATGNKPAVQPHQAQAPINAHHREPGSYGLALQARQSTGLYDQWMASFQQKFAPKAAIAATAPKVWNPVPNEGAIGGLSVTAKVFTATGGVKPGETFPLILKFSAGDAASLPAQVKVKLHPSAVFVSATPAASSASGADLTFNVLPLAPDASSQIVVVVRAKRYAEDAEVHWKNLFSNVTVEMPGQTTLSLRTLGPKVTEFPNNRFGDRPFPVVMVQYQDIKHCTAEGERGGLPTDANDHCPANHTAANLDFAVNDKDSNTSIYQLFQDMSFGQLKPIGTVLPRPDAGTVAFDATYNHKFSSPQVPPPGTCTGTTLAGTPTYKASSNRIDEGWYTLPGTQAYYGADKYGHNLAAAAAGQAAVGGIDDACGPTGKIIYDAASLVDADVDYNDFDTDRDGVVDFFNLMFAGDGGNGNTTTTGLGNIWPHKSDARAYFTDANGEKGYVSNDQLRNHFEQPMFWADEGRQVLTTTDTGIKAFVKVGPYNVNPENANEFVSVIAHEYGHSLGLPDFYSLGARETFASWNLMATDYFHFMTGYDRSRMGWIVPRALASSVDATGSVTLRESKTDIGEIRWARPDGTAYTLTGDGIHNADTFKVNLPTARLIDVVPSGTHAWFSGSGNDFGCPGHYLDVFLPGMADTAAATAIALKFKSLYEIEWDFDYGFVLVSTDNGRTFTSVASRNGTTIASNYNPNGNGCLTQYNNGITGVSGGGANNVANTNRATSAYPTAQFIADEFDLTAFKGKAVVLRFAYSTDPGLAKRGWFIDDVSVTAGSNVIYSSDFEKGRESDTLFPRSWQLASTADGVDTEHAYYIELRDRLSNDFDGKGQSERGGPTWEAGVSMIYTDENHGYGNTGVDNPPAQSPVDSAPQPGNDTPVLDDAAFTLTRPLYNGCTHVDNYTDPKGPEGLWKLPNKLKFNLVSLNNVNGAANEGMAPALTATATLLAEVNPDCDLEVLPPVISIASGYENPDTNGAYGLSWTRPVGAIGPDTLQEATTVATLFEDNAESGLGKWVATTEGQGATAWAASTLKFHAGSNSFRGSYANGSDAAQSGNKPAALLTMKDAVSVPADGDTLLSYWDFYINEGDDLVILEASSDDGATWNVLAQSARSELAPDAAMPVANEALSFREYSLADFKGKSVKVRYRMQSGGEDRAGSVPFGWFVDDIKIETSNFRDIVVKTPQTAAAVTGRGTGTYFYRVKTSYPAGASAVVPSPYSNVVTLMVKEGVVAAPPGTPTVLVGTLAGAPVGSSTGVAGGGRFGGGLGAGLLALLAAAAAVRRRRQH